MGIFTRFRKSRAAPVAVDEGSNREDMVGEVSLVTDDTPSNTFNNLEVTYRGNMNNIPYETIQRNKEHYIYDLYALSDYYVDADPIFRGIIKQVLVPFSITDPWKLVGANEETKRKYEAYYDKIELKEKLESIMYQYFKYSNVYVYLFNDGRIITLPPHMVRIANVSVNEEPLLEFNCTQVLMSLGLQRSVASAQNYQKDSEIELRVKGYPPEVAEGIRKCQMWVQLNPHNTFTLQDTKEDWERYAIPMIASCLMALKKKAIISDWENSNLKLGTRSFLHVKYGDPDGEVLPNTDQLSRVYSTFKKAMQGTALAVTNHWAEAKFLQPDLDEIFHYDKYNSVNSEILSVGGISDIIVSGQTTTNATFATAQVSMQTATIRIRKAREKFCNMMNRINQRLNERGFTAIPHSAPDQIPTFTFPPVDLAGTKQFQEVCLKLYNLGIVSKETMLQAHGFDMKQEYERRKSERDKGIDEVLSDPSMIDTVDETSTTTNQSTVNNTTNDDGYETYTRNGRTYRRRKRQRKTNTDTTTETVRGRPTESYNERGSDPAKSETGRQPKPSNPEGSTPQT